MGKKKEVTNEMILNVVLSLDERLNNVEAHMATKSDLKLTKEEILEEIHPVEKAVDKDAETLVDYGRRLTRVEKHLSLN